MIYYFTEGGEFEPIKQGSSSTAANMFVYKNTTYPNIYVKEKVGVTT
jgi:hypothetical protein